MLNLIKTPARLRDIPADIETALARPDWRRHVAWPVSLAEANRIGADQMRDALAWANGLDDPLLRDAALLALPVVLAYARAIVLAALAADRARRLGMRLVGTAPELAYLETGEGPLPVRTEPIMAPPRFRLAFGRRVARLRSWTTPARMPRALLRPDAVAISHNPLLCAAAAREERAIGFRHAETILDAALRHAGKPPDSAHDVSALARTMLGETMCDEPYRSRAIRLLEATARRHLEKAVRDMSALRSIVLPDEIWTGSGGLYAPRAVGLEVLRRGGRVRRFDHGTPREFVATAPMTSLLELSVSSEFVLATEGAAEICRMEIGSGSHAAIRGGDGDPMFARVPASRGRARREKLRVVYAPTQLLGFRQLVPALPPDVVHLDWQMRVAGTLCKLPVDFTCQAHPEGLFVNRPHPLESIARTIRGNFDAQLQSADVFVFDYPATTALWEAACTDARIVYLDMGAGKMTPKIKDLFAKRATVIPVTHEENHRLTFDEIALRNAVLADAGPGDPAAFRRLLAGRA